MNLRRSIGRGMSPQDFVDGMQIRTMELSGIQNTKQRFITEYEQFAWRNEEDRTYFSGIRERSDLGHCLILCTDWCPDVIWNVPLLLRVLETCGIPGEILPMEEHLDVMDLFLTDGGRAQPVAAFLNTNGDVLGRWGARPAYIQAAMDRFKEEHPDKSRPEYMSNLDRTYRRIGELYREDNGARYRDAIIQELKILFTAFPKEARF
ncbi:thioredoxin family protein [Paenibacillus sp.]|uniref:thioredoxin family protein n=1 Tax=Paenibacillus sp. TaxID=58172 RepID=UPI002812185D|nr:thioredoxin family protein [Paenibacillus sp.]